MIVMDVFSVNASGVNTLFLNDIGSELLEGLTVGIYWDFFNHCDPNITEVCAPAVEVLKELGASVVDIKIPELEESRIAHMITISAEMANGLACDVEKQFHLFNLETLLLLTAGFQSSAIEYVNAQKQRTRAITYLKHLFNDVDVIVTPTTACVAPKIDPDAIPRGKSLGIASGKLIRFANISNFAGNPALTYPVGYASNSGLPVGLQLIGKWHEDSTLFRVAWALEKSARFPKVKPKIFYDILQTATEAEE